jgi:lipopolysaccharide biosynthesis protein
MGIIILITIIIVLFVHFNKTNKEKYNDIKTDNKIVCLYAYYEKDNQYKNNLEFFLNKGGILEEIDYYIIVNGQCTVNIPEYKNIKIIYRENKGYDFGAYFHVLENHINKKYDYYVFLNTSVCGPYYLEKNNKKWIDYFLELFNKTDVKIVGTSINMSSLGTHVQSMFFVITNDYLDILKKEDFINEKKINNYTNIWDIVVNYEIKLSKIALDKGYNINCILSKYKDKDYRVLKNNINPSNDDPYFPNKYFNGTIDKYEVIFFKNTRIPE